MSQKSQAMDHENPATGSCAAKNQTTATPGRSNGQDLSALERVLSYGELHFPVRQPQDTSLPTPDPSPSPFRLRARRHWPAGASYRNPQAYGVRPQFSGKLNPDGGPVCRDSRSRVPWDGKLEDLIDVDWATDPSVIDEEDAPFLQMYIRTCVMAGEYGSGLGKKEVHLFLDAHGRERRMELPQGANVGMCPWKAGVWPMPPEERILKVDWTYLGVEK